jgi:drug/metabolite transporter (DMT)-like permease
MDKKIRLKTYAGLHLIVLLYALGGIFSKNAANAAFLSQDYILNYGMVLGILAVYALLWQKILKKLPLTVAMANKSVTVIWGLIFGRLIFHESITIWSIIGAVVIVVGILIVVDADKEQEACI